MRELQNAIERSVLLGKDSWIRVVDLPNNITNESAVISTPVVDPDRKQTLKEALEGPARQIIYQVLKENSWNRNATADQLGINRTTLYKKMKKLDLEQPQ